MSEYRTIHDEARELLRQLPKEELIKFGLPWIARSKLQDMAITALQDHSVEEIVSTIVSSLEDQRVQKMIRKLEKRMGHLKQAIKLLAGEFGADGEYLTIPDSKSVFGFDKPTPGEPIVAAVFESPDGETARAVMQESGDIYFYTSRWDDSFGNVQELANFLNKNHYIYIGADKEEY